MGWGISSGHAICASLFRPMSLSATRAAITVINSQWISCKKWPAASSIHTPALSPGLFHPLLQTNNLISADTVWPPSIITAHRLVLISPPSAAPFSFCLILETTFVPDDPFVKFLSFTNRALWRPQFLSLLIYLYLSMIFTGRTSERGRSIRLNSSIEVSSRLSEILHSCQNNYSHHSTRKILHTTE